MIKHSTNPLDFPRSLRSSDRNILTTGRAGEVIPLTFVPLFRGDTATGQITVEAELAEMPKPLENAIWGRLQTWCIPRPALPHFESVSEYRHAYQGKSISKLGAADRTPPSLFDTVSSGSIAAAEASELFRAAGISLRSAEAINTDYIDCYALVYNFRLAAHSSKMTRVDYYQEDNTASLELKPAFWPRNRMHDVVADYEQAVVTGQLDLDVISGSVPVMGIAMRDGSDNTWRDAAGVTYGTNASGPSATGDFADGSLNLGTTAHNTPSASDAALASGVDGSGDAVANIYGNLAGQTIGTSLANIDMARREQAFARAIAAMDGNQFSGFNNDDVLILDLMNGLTVDEELLNRPWLLDSKTGVFGQTERHATDAANLDDSVTIGNLGLRNSINIPLQKHGAVVMATFEYGPERLHERQADDYLYCTSEADLPNALRDYLNPEPVEVVTNGQIDTAHGTPGGTYGYRELNGKWNSEMTRLGGDFRQLTPGTPSTVARNAIWQADYVNPSLTSDHYIMPHPFPQDPFSVPSSDTVTISARLDLTVSGITQRGSKLVEDNAEFADLVTEAT